MPLNPSQETAVKSCGFQLILAGPGSGKTRVVTEKTLHLIDQGIPPNQVLALTFSDMAAAVMSDRIEKKRPHPGLAIHTFHSFCLDILKENVFASGMSVCGRDHQPHNAARPGPAEHRRVRVDELDDLHLPLERVPRSLPAGLLVITLSARPSFMSPSPGNREDGITHDIVRFLAWLKKRGAHQRLIYCRKKWDGNGIDINVMCRGPARGMIRVQSDPSTGEKWVVLDDLVLADNLTIEFGEEVPHHSQWREL